MLEKILSAALAYRKSLECFRGTETLRVFYGPGETDHAEYRNLAIDQFQNHFWVTTWKAISKKTQDELIQAIRSLFAGAQSIVWMDRSQVASEADSVVLWGEATPEKFSVKEYGVPYLVQMADTKHPGLFLDHSELRQWLQATQSHKSVLNLFSYTGSLSVAAGFSGAAKVTTLDLSRTTIDWAKENWKNAGLLPEAGDFIFGDVFEWLPKFKKRGDLYDTILCDPPSFSRSKNGVFSTNKDSAKLHELIFPLLKPGGVLVTSINSENYPEKSFLKDIENAARLTRTDIRVLKRIDLPLTFPTGTELQERYLKGFYILKG